MPFAGLLLLGVTASGFVALAPPFVRFVVAFAALVWIPGVVIVRDLLGARPDSPLLRYPLYLFGGVSAASLVTWPLVVGDAPFPTYTAVLAWLVAALLIVGGVRSWRRRDAALNAPLGALAALILLGAVAGVQPVSLGVERDASDHIGYIRQIQATGSLAPDGVLAARVDVDAPIPHDPRKGTYHDVLAAVASLSGVDPLTLWRYQPLLLFPLAFFAFVGFCREFVARTWQLAACVGLFALSYGGVGYQYPETVAYGQNLAVAWYWALVPLVLRDRWATPRREEATLAVLCAGGTLVHFGVALHALVLAATVLVFARWFDRGAGVRRRAVAVVAATVVAAVGKLLWVHGQANAIHMHDQGLLTMGRWFVVSPLEVLRQHGMLFLGGLAITPLLLGLRRDETARRQLAFVAIPAVVCFVPFVTTPLVREATYLVSRSLLNVPVFPIIVVAVAGVASWSRARAWSARTAGALVLIVWALVFVAPTARAVVRGLGAGGGNAPPSVPAELVDYVRSLPRESVILSDTKTAYTLSAMTPHRYVAVNGQHANPLDPWALDRLEAVRDVLSPFAVSSTALAACDRYGVDFVVCNAVAGARGRDFLSTWDSADFPLTVARLDAIAGRFRRVHEGGDFTVFLYDEAGSGRSLWGPPGSLVSYTPVAGMNACDVTAPGGAFRVSSVAVTPAEALPGETVSVTVGYEKTRQSPFGLPFVLHFRFDHEGVAAAADFPGAKHLRRARERSGGVTMRLTRTHVPFDGRYQVDLWPIGKEFFETVDVDLPVSLIPGTYSVLLSVERQSLLPNFSIRDLLYNHDRLDGTRCAELTVTRQRVRTR